MRATATRSAAASEALARRWAAVLAPTVALLVALGVGELLILAYGESPARVLGLLVAGTWRTPYGIGQVLFKATPLVLTGLAVAVPFRAGLFNIGAEGQVVLGALAAGLAGLALPSATPALLAVPAVAGAGALAGAAWGGLPGLLKARWGAHEVITTIMLNFVAVALASYVVVHTAVPETVHTAPIIESARLTRLGELFPALRGSAASTAVLGAALAALATGYLLFRTATGHELRAAGLGPAAARCAGISPLRTATLSMAVGGGLAGLVGMSFVQGYKHYYEDGFSGGVGFMGIAVALLGRNHPLGVVLAALLFGTLSQGGLVMNALVPKELVDVLQAIVILAVVAADREVRGVLVRAFARRAARGRAA